MRYSATGMLPVFMPSLEERLRVLEDQEAIRQTFRRYARAIDYGGDASRLLDCFTATAHFSYSPVGRWAGADTLDITGHAQLADWFAGSPARGTAGHFSKHLIVEPDISLDNDRATVDSYYVVAREYEHGPQLGSIGRYRATLVRADDGRWRFEKLTIEREGTLPAS